MTVTILRTFSGRWYFTSAQGPSTSNWATRAQARVAAAKAGLTVVASE